MVRCSAKAIKSTAKINWTKKKNVVNNNGGKKILQKENVAVRTAKKVAKEVQNRIRLQRNKQKAFNAKPLDEKAFQWISKEQAEVEYLLGNTEGDQFCLVEDLNQYVAEYAITDKSAASKPFATMSELQEVLDYLVKINVLSLQDSITYDDGECTGESYDWTTVDAFKDMVKLQMATKGKDAMKKWCDEYCDGSGVQEDLIYESDDDFKLLDEDEDEEDEEEENANLKEENTNLKEEHANLKEEHAKLVKDLNEVEEMVKEVEELIKEDEEEE